MSQDWIPQALRLVVRQRSASFCEYCGIPETGTFFGHQVDHVIAEQHGGEAILENLAFACAQCNRFKGPNIASIDPDTRRMVPLFSPGLISGQITFSNKLAESSRSLQLAEPPRAF